MDNLLLAKPVLKEIYAQIEDYMQSLEPETPRPRLDVIMVGENQASTSYVNRKLELCKKFGIQSKLHHFEELSHTHLLQLIRELNNDHFVSGILVQLPLPANIFVPEVIKAIDPRKDVDGFHAYNLGKLLTDKEFETLSPCTPKAVIKLMEHYQVPIRGQNIVVVGHSNIVGKPLAVMLINRDATVTVCNKETKDLSFHTLKADILISATGVANLIQPAMIKPKAILIDVGFTKIDSKILGDIDPSCLDKAAALSPVPGGVGPLTVAYVALNTIRAHQWHIENS